VIYSLTEIETETEKENFVNGNENVSKTETKYKQNDSALNLIVIETKMISKRKWLHTT